VAVAVSELDSKKVILKFWIIHNFKEVP